MNKTPRDTGGRTGEHGGPAALTPELAAWDDGRPTGVLSSAAIFGVGIERAWLVMHGEPLSAVAANSQRDTIQRSSSARYPSGTRGV